MENETVVKSPSLADRVIKKINDSELPEETKSKAILEIRSLDALKQCSDVELSDDSNELKALFVWKNTISGHDFWMGIDNALRGL